MRGFLLIVVAGSEEKRVVIWVEEVEKPTGHILVDGERFAHCDPSRAKFNRAWRGDGRARKRSTEVAENAKAPALRRGLQWVGLYRNPSRKRPCEAPTNRALASVENALPKC